MRLVWMERTAIVMIALCISGCMFRKLDEQLQQIDELCVISGTISGDAANRDPRVVLLLQATPPGMQPSWRIADHFVSEGDGRWIMVAQPGDYALAAFEDRSRDLVYQPGEPVLRVSEASQVQCARSSRIADRALIIPADGAAFAGEVDVTDLQARTPDQQLGASLRSLAASGALTTLDDPRFSAENVRSGMWTPYDFLLHAGPGVYFLEPYDPTRIPVLFVHGIEGSPLNFTHLIANLDRSKFQPWIYYYPSGARLGRVADHLAQTMLELEVRYRVPQVAVVAHSMGGLVSRGYLLRRSGGARVPLFITLSTPWGGHNAAQMGVEYAPTVVRSWYDMAPGSEYLQTLFETGLNGTEHHLLFSFRRSSTSFGESGDGVVTLASELRPEAQQQARALYGFDDTHTGILADAAAVALVNRLLAELP